GAESRLQSWRYLQRSIIRMRRALPRDGGASGEILSRSTPGRSVQADAAFGNACAARGAATSLPDNKAGISLSTSAKSRIGACGMFLAMQCAISLPLAKTKSAASATQKSEAPSPISSTFARLAACTPAARAHLQVPLETRQVALACGNLSCHSRADTGCKWFETTGNESSP